MGFEKKSNVFWIVTGILLVVIVGIVDNIIGYEYAFSLFYLIPISIATRYAGLKIGIFISVTCALSWFAADRLNEHPYSHPTIPYWNTFIRFSVFLIVTILISALRKRTIKNNHLLALII